MSPKLFVKLTFLQVITWLCMLANANPHVSILQYHHVSDSTPSITSISPEGFEQHMAYLAAHHKVVSLETMHDSLINKTALPEYAVAITFDDGFKNILENAHPILMKYGFSYTVFINPAQIGGSQSQLSWDEVKMMATQGVTFANHTLDHIHLLTRYPYENDEDWLNRVANDIEMAEKMIHNELGYSRKWLAYPFGEFDLSLKKLLSDKGYLAFGQQSGAAAWYSAHQALPRFPASGRYANLDTLKTKLKSLAMPVLDTIPSDPKVALGTSSKDLRLIIETSDFIPKQFACYFKGKKLDMSFETVDVKAYEQHDLVNDKAQINMFKLNIQDIFKPGRSRVNCTAPSLSKRGRFYWYSMPFFTATEKGKYLD